MQRTREWNTSSRLLWPLYCLFHRFQKISTRSIPLSVCSMVGNLHSMMPIGILGECVDQTFHLCLDTLHRYSIWYTDRLDGGVISNNTQKNQLTLLLILLFTLVLESDSRRRQREKRQSSKTHGQRTSQRGRRRDRKREREREREESHTRQLMRKMKQLQVEKLSVQWNGKKPCSSWVLRTGLFLDLLQKPAMMQNIRHKHVLCWCASFSWSLLFLNW